MTNQLTMDRIQENLTQAQRDALDAFWAQQDPDAYEHSDNYRYATKGNPDEEHLYDATAAGGCCGSCDVELPCSDGSVLLFGFNYGH